MTSPMKFQHLTDDQIDDHLIGDLAPAASEHLAGCGACMARVAEAEAPIASFKAVSLAWSERRSATLPLTLAAALQPNWRRHLAWGSVVTAALAVGICIPVVHHQAEVAQTASIAVPASPKTSNDEQIARDNKMLQAIDRELNASVDNPAAFGLLPASQQRAPVRSASLQN